MIPLFIISNTPFTGKTFLSLGIGLSLKERGLKVGYIKPVGSHPVKVGRMLYAADSIFMKEALALDDPLDVISPFVMNYEAQESLLKGDYHDVLKKVMDAFKAQSDKDVLIVGGSGSIFNGYSFGIDIFKMIRELEGRVIIVDSWKAENTADTILGLANLLKENIAGGIINKVPLSALTYVRTEVSSFLERSGVPLIGAFPNDSLLESISVRHLMDLLGGRLLCCEEGLDEYVEHFSVGAMDVDNALNYFRRLHNKAVITGAHRSDIQLAAMETSTKCIILTGGLQTNDVVVKRAEAKGIPILSVSEDTFTVIDTIETAIGKTRIREASKTARAKEMVAAEIDFERLLKTLRR
ncbi:MAG: phosphotransacetylase family protein [Dissulfurispiraceae bacterium]|nr:phosphotransacetylase family protein [Dissulfurispiraceae bacterium]